MATWFDVLFAKTGFMPHGNCFIWHPGVLWLHVISDTLIVLAYYSIPFALWYFVQKRRDLLYRWVFMLFGAFIFLCGTTHLLGIWTIWVPQYWLAGWIKLITALVSLVTAVLVWPLIPKVLRLPSPAQLLCVNEQLNTTIEQLKRSQDELRKFGQALSFTPSLVLITDLQGRIEYCNDALLRVMQYTREELLGQRASFLQSGLTRQQVYKDLWRTILSGETWHGEIMDRKKNGELIWLLQSIAPIKEENGRISHFIAVSHDISERKQHESLIQKLAYYDPLTELPNRYLFKERLEQALLHYQRHGNQFALLYLDLDHFKNINDTLGHITGDKLLIEVGRRIHNHLRAEDTVARLGGDEFAVLLKHIDDIRDVARIAETLIQQISQPYQIDGHELFISTSIGISLCPKDSEDKDVLIKQADGALYQAKAAGRNKFEFFNEEYTRLSLEKLRLETDLRHAVERQELCLFYQPKLNLETGIAKTLEALLRWHHPELGLITPDKFIHIAEETGLIVELGEWVMREACRQLVIWRQQGLAISKIAINLSLRQLRDPHLLTKVDRLLTETGLCGEDLEFEITESVMMENLEHTQALLHGCKHRQIHLAIDDFGTGYSSLSHLKRLPVHSLKIDRSFVQDLTHDHDNLAIVKAVISLAQSLGLHVVAEGVEQMEQLQLLRAQYCHEVQGYLLSPPVPAAQLPDVLAALNERFAFQAAVR